MKNSKNIPYYLLFFIFNFIFNGILVGGMVLLDEPSDVPYIVIMQFIFLLILFRFGQYFVAFIFGLYFQKKYSLPLFRIWILAGFQFLLLILFFSPFWKPTLDLSDLNTRHLIIQSLFQAICFLAGSYTSQLFDYVNRKKQY